MKKLRPAIYICFAIFVISGVISRLVTTEGGRNAVVVLAVISAALFFALLTIEAVATGEVSAKGVSIKKPERPIQFYIMVTLYGSTSVTILLGLLVALLK